MKKGVIIAVAVLLALLAAAGVMLTTKQKEDSPPVRTIEDAMDNNTITTQPNPNDEIILSQNAQIAQLQAQLADLERKMAQKEFDYTALKAEKDKLEKRSADLEGQNRYLRDRNGTLSSAYDKEKAELGAQINDLNSKMAQQESDYNVLLAAKADLEKQRTDLEEHNAALNERLARIDQEREASEAAYQEALARIEEYEAQAAITQAALEEANTVPGTRVTQEGETVSTFKTAPSGQARNIVGIKIGGSDIDLEATFALMPHWFLIADLGAVETADDFVEEEFPGLKADHSFVYTAMFGTGFNWRFNSLQGQPNVYIATMLGPAWYSYYYKSDDREGIKTYLLWRSSVGFDMTLYKNLQFTTDLSFDYMKDFGFTPHLTVGLQWSFSNSWAAFGNR